MSVVPHHRPQPWPRRASWHATTGYCSVGVVPAGAGQHSRSPRRQQFVGGVDEVTAEVFGGRPRGRPENAGAAPALPQRRKHEERTR